MCHALALAVALGRWARSGWLLLVLVLVLLPPLGAQTSPGSPADGVSYGRDIRPLLADRCFRCHGPDGSHRKADLRLDSAAAASAPREHGAAIVPFAPDRSLLLHRIAAHDPAERMPPAASGKPPLTAEQVALVRAWIAAGAVYEPHWAFVPPRRPELPTTVQGRQPDDNPIDTFVAARLQANGLTRSPRADPTTLVRRLYLVLTGLPPTPAEIDAFVHDADPGAYERLVDRLLTEEPYRTRGAEHFAQPWLDAARYADTSGIHMDAGRQIWPWRDWLLMALRDDLPFDRFVIDQLAGDLVPDGTLAQRVASGFLRLHVTTDEGGAIDEEYRVEYAAERTAVVGSVMLGLTIGCARCHDHKFDPIRQEDYYRLFAFFNSNEEPGLYSQTKDSNRALEPFLEVPSPTDTSRRHELLRQLQAAQEAADTETPAERQASAQFLAALQDDDAATWSSPAVTDATSRHGATLTVLDDGSVLVGGDNPKTDQHLISLSTDQTAQRWLCLSALTDPSLPHGKIGRAPNGNAVLQHVQLHARPRGSDGDYQAVPLVYALADIEQQNGDFAVGNSLFDDGRGWAVAAHQHAPGERHAMFLAATPFGWPGGTELRVTLTYDSVHQQHVLGRVRFHLGTASDAVLARLPLATSGFYTAGPFEGDDGVPLYDLAHGPESATRLDVRHRWGDIGWRLVEPTPGSVVHTDLPKGKNATYVGQLVHSPDARTTTVALGSDDGFQLFVNGEQRGERRVDRSVAADQDRLPIDLRKGPNLLVLKVVNTGGDAGFSLQHLPPEHTFDRDLGLALLPAVARSPAIETRVRAAYRRQFSPRYLAQRAEVERLEAAVAALDRTIPRTMVMQESAMPRPTFVLQRGDYDKPDPERPVARELPLLFGVMPAEAPRNRLGLASWMVSEANPLLLRVAMNRLWQFVFGTGIVRTSEDFGLQGEWPSHPELLDWLAVEFRSRGLHMRAMLRCLVTSETFCQSSVRPAAAAAVDPDNRLLGWFPRRRLSAEAIRDTALYVSGLLVERTGGPSVKPPQPKGLWREVAMVQSNTRTYEPNEAPEIWRRSLYVYWKRACPPPTLLVLDAPTREFCTIRRTTTNTPLQALALWNDVQFLEAARLLAQHTLQQPGTETERLQRMHRQCTGRPMDGERLALAERTLQTLRQRFAAAPEDAAALRLVGEAAQDATLLAVELAPFLVLANAFLNLDATLCLD